jgi:hypothetical protein
LKILKLFAAQVLRSLLLCEKEARLAVIKIADRRNIFMAVVCDMGLTGWLFP